MLTAEQIEAVRNELTTALGALDRAERIVYAEAMRGRDYGESTYIRRKVKRARGNVYEAERWVDSEARCLEEYGVGRRTDEVVHSLDGGVDGIAKKRPTG